MNNTILYYQERLNKDFRPFTKAEALKALELHEDNGNGAEGTAYKFIPMTEPNGKAQRIGDNLINLGRHLKTNEDKLNVEPINSRELTILYRCLKDWNQEIEQREDIPNDLKAAATLEAEKLILKLSLLSE